MSGDPEQEYFADGMVEEIITALSRIRWLFVIARNSSFTYKGQAIDVKQVGRELGVRYVLEGSVRKAGQRVRITAQLIDTTTGAHLWADRFDGSLEDIFDLQDKAAASVAAVIEPALRAVEIRRASEHETRDLTAYDLYLRSLAHSSGSEAALNRALDLLEQAIDRDPRYGRDSDFTPVPEVAKEYLVGQYRGTYQADAAQADQPRRLTLLGGERCRLLGLDFGNHDDDLV